MRSCSRLVGGGEDEVGGCESGVRRCRRLRWVFVVV